LLHRFRDWHKTLNMDVIRSKMFTVFYWLMHLT
jgi:hypothetical protein